MPNRTYRSSTPHLGPQVRGGGRPEGNGDRPVLTLHQRAVVVLIADGLTDKEIASRLGTTAKTIGSEIVKIRLRLDALNRAHAAAIAIRRGLIT